MVKEGCDDWESVCVCASGLKADCRRAVGSCAEQSDVRKLSNVFLFVTGKKDVIDGKGGSENKRAEGAQQHSILWD